MASSQEVFVKQDLKEGGAEEDKTSAGHIPIQWTEVRETQGLAPRSQSIPQNRRSTTFRHSHFIGIHVGVCCGGKCL